MEPKGKKSFKPKLKEKTWNRRIEPILFRKWQEEQLFKFGKKSDIPTFSIDTPPPYVDIPFHKGQAYIDVWMGISESAVISQHLAMLER